MKWVRAFLYLIVCCLFLEVIKTVIERQQNSYGYFTATVLICVQVLCVSGFFVYWLCTLLFKRIGGGKKIIPLVATLSFFVLLELYFAYLLKHPQQIPAFFKWSFTYYYDYYNCPLPQFEEKASVYNPQLYYTLKPGARFRYYNEEFDNDYSINSKGVRDDENSLHSPEIICLGDSYTMGWGVEQQETFAQELERQSGRKTLNAGVSSYGTAREMIQLKQFDTSALKCLVIQYCSNDIGENQSYLANHYALIVSGKSSYDSLVIQQRLLNAYFPGKYGLLISQSFLKRSINKLTPVFPLEFAREDPFTNEEQHAKYFIDILYNAPVNFSKTKVIVTVLDNYDRLNNNFLNAVGRLAVQSPYKDRFGGNLEMLNLSGTLRKDEFYELDLHIRASGHKKVADELWKIIRPALYRIP